MICKHCHLEIEAANSPAVPDVQWRHTVSRSLICWNENANKPLRPFKDAIGWFAEPEEET
jgi:hypothetical protein